MAKRISLKRKRPTYELLTELLPLMRASSELSTVAVSAHEQALIRQLVLRIDYLEQSVRRTGQTFKKLFTDLVVAESCLTGDETEAPATPHDREDALA